MRNALWLFAIVAMSCGSDSGKSPTPWGVDEQEPNGTTTPDPTPDPDPTPTPTPSPDPAPTCGAAQLALLDVTSPAPVGPIPVVVGDRVFAASRTLDSAGQDIMEWDGEHSLEPFAATPDDDFIVGASERWLWTATLDGLYRVDLQSGSMELIAQDGPLPGFYDFDGYAQPRQTAFGDRFVFGSDGGVHLFDGVSLTTYEAAGPRQLWVNDEAVAWAGWDGGEATLTVRADDGWEIPFTASEFGYGSPVLAAGRVYFTRNGEVIWANYRGAAMGHVLTERSCGPLDSDGTTLVVACNPELWDTYPSWGDYLELGARELWAIDAQSGEAELLYTTSDSSIYAPVVSDRWIAWVEYPPVTNAQQFLEGTIKVLPRGATVPFDVARMGQGCPYCGAYWPAPRLDLGRDILAFNYGIANDAGPTGDSPRAGLTGVARLVECE